MCLAGTRETISARQESAAPSSHRHDASEPPAPTTANRTGDRSRLSRRALLGAGLGAALTAAWPAAPALARRVPTRAIVDLTQVFAVDMPTFGPEKPHRETMADFPMPPEGEFAFYNQRWTFTEHVGTHIDPPGHVIGGGRLSPEVTPDELLAPAVVIDIRAKAAADPNATVTVDDVVAFERRHGRIPRGAAVLMDSGWAERWDDGDLAYRGTASLEEFPFNFPGFDPEACDFLIRRRDIVGVGVDTLSTDPGASVDFPAHEVLGRADRWGLENLANLERLPPRGATLVVGLVPWEAGSGGPCRVLAFW